MSNCHSVLCLCGALLISEKSGKRMKHVVFRYKTRCILQNKVSPDFPQDLFGRGRCSVDPDEWCKCFPAPAFPWEQTSSSSSAGEAGGCGLCIDNLTTHTQIVSTQCERGANVHKGEHFHHFPCKAPFLSLSGSVLFGMVNKQLVPVFATHQTLCSVVKQRQPKEEK